MTADSHAPPIISSRWLDVSPARVFEAYANPARLAAWWGPAGFVNRFERFDFREGGSWDFVMEGPDGAAYSIHKRFERIVPGSRIVIRHLQEGHDFVMDSAIAPEGEGTRLTWTMRFEDPAEAARVREFILGANEENFARLAAHLAET